MKDYPEMQDALEESSGTSALDDGLGAIRWRKEVVAFADAMEAKLRKNDWKAPWQGMGLQYLSMRLTQEREELRRAVEAGNPDDVLHEAADVANFAMMIADRVRRYPKATNVKSEPDRAASPREIGSTGGLEGGR